MFRGREQGLNERKEDQEERRFQEGRLSTHGIQEETISKQSHWQEEMEKRFMKLKTKVSLNLHPRTFSKTVFTYLTGLPEDCSRTGKDLKWQERYRVLIRGTANNLSHLINNASFQTSPGVNLLFAKITNDWSRCMIMYRRWRQAECKQSTHNDSESYKEFCSRPGRIPELT